MEALQTYLQDHLAGSHHAIALLERCADNHREDELGPFFQSLLDQVRIDQGALRSLLRRVGGRNSPPKQVSTWLVEKIQRVKMRDSPDATPDLDLLEILEFLSIAVAGKQALWEALEAAAGGSKRFGGLDLGTLRSRAGEQRAEIERRRLSTALGALRRVEPEREDEPRPPLRAAILDIDGTLVDSNDAHARSWVDALVETGRPANLLEIRPLIGMGGDKLLPEVAEIDADSDEGRELSRLRGEIFRERYLGDVGPVRGARALLERFRDEGLILVVATSSEADHVKALLEAGEVADLIEGATSADDADESKPDPDVVEAALRNAGCEPDEALLLGDTPFDVDAGRQAGVGVVALRCGGSADPELGGALAVYDGPEDLLARFDTSPFGRRLTERRPPVPT